jgi:hypothetical protein
VDQAQPPAQEDIAVLANTLNTLSVGLGALTSSGANIPEKTSTGITQTGSVSQSTPKPPEKSEPIVHPLGIPLLAKLMPDVNTKIAESKGIFDIKIFSNIAYTTYRDEKNKVNIYAFAESYPVMLTNLKLASNVYAVKETDTFFEASFFLNSLNKKDSTIRFVTSIDGKAYGFELPKSFYPRIKKLLTSK